MPDRGFRPASKRKDDRIIKTLEEEALELLRKRGGRDRRAIDGVFSALCRKYDVTAQELGDPLADRIRQAVERAFDRYKQEA